MQREVAKPEVLTEGLYRKRYRFFSDLPMEMQILFVYNSSVSFADSSLYTRKQRAWADRVVRPYKASAYKEGFKASAPTGHRGTRRAAKATSPGRERSLFIFLTVISAA